jgi:hypothetical protein
LKDLANETFIAYGGQQGAGIHAVAFRAFQAAGFNPVSRSEKLLNRMNQM